MLLRMRGDRALPDLRLIIAGEFAMLLFGQFVPQLAVEMRPDARKRARFGDAPAE